MPFTTGEESPTQGKLILTLVPIIQELLGSSFSHRHQKSGFSLSMIMEVRTKNLIKKKKGFKAYET